MSDKFKNFLTEGKVKLKPKLSSLDDKIEKFIEMIEKQIDAIEDNPVFQRKVNQMLVDMSKEHGEFILALRAVVAALDRGAQMIPMRKPEFQARGIDNQTEEIPEEPEEVKNEEIPN
ncbi:MAG TPA: hypothetical protein VMZ91_06320 [Candidatus Paceibacterota bacterium]|nr:hypothetical protein [Candidatus Paceibacterota bacterium]